MGTLRCPSDVSDVVIDGVILGDPAQDEETGEYLWDHPGIPEGDIVPDDTGGA